MASDLHADLEKAGYTSWLDVKMEDRSEAGMKEGVVNCKVVLAIITGECVNPDWPQDAPESNAYSAGRSASRSCGGPAWPGYRSSR